MPLDLNNLKDAEEFQKHFVRPLIDAVRLEVQPLVAKDAEQERRLGTLEGNQKKALWGFALYATALSVFVGMAADWLKRKVGWNHE